MKKNLVLDYKEVLTCNKRRAYKGAVVLSGGIVEAILINRSLNLSPKRIQEVQNTYYSLVPETEKKEKNLKIENMDLYYLIKTLDHLHIITSPQASRGDVLRDYRNLIHPFKKGDRPTIEDSKSVIKLLNDLLLDFGKTVKPKSSDIDKAYSFLTHSAYKVKRDKNEYKVILELFCKKQGSLTFEELLSLSLFQSKKYPSRSLIASVNYLKDCNLCTYDSRSWKGYPVKRYEKWIMNNKVRRMVEEYLLKRMHGISQPIAPQIKNYQKNDEFTNIEKKILSTLYQNQKQSFQNDNSKRWTFVVTPYAKDEYNDYLDGVSKLLKKGLIAVSSENYHCMLTNEGLDYCEKNKSILDEKLVYIF